MKTKIVGDRSLNWRVYVDIGRESAARFLVSVACDYIANVSTSPSFEDFGKNVGSRWPSSMS